MKKIENGQINEKEKVRFDKKEKARRSFALLILIVLVANAFYLYESYKFGEARTQLMNLIEIFNIFISFGIYVVIVAILRNDVTDVSCFLQEIDSLMSSNESWGSGRKSLRFVNQWRLYSGFDELKKDVESLRCTYSKRCLWFLVSVILFLPFLLLNSVEVLFCGEKARILMVWTDDVAFYLFYIPKCISSIMLIISFSLFMYYKDKVMTIVNNPTKTKLIMKDMSDLL